MAVEGAQIVVPAIVVVEVACALARKLSSASTGRRLADDVLSSASVLHRAVDDTLLSAAVQVGPNAALRGADAIYAATAHLTGTQLISWDNELVRRAGALTPTGWLDVSP